MREQKFRWKAFLALIFVIGSVLYTSSKIVASILVFLYKSI